MATTSKSPKRVSWACPLVKSTSSFLPIQQQQNSSCFNNRDAHDPVQICRPAANKLHGILQDSTSSQPGSRHDSLSSNNAREISTFSEDERGVYVNQREARARYQHREEQEKCRYAQSRIDREHELLSRDALYQDPYYGVCWTATCKFVDVLASRHVESKLDRRLRSDLLVALFVNGDFTFSSKKLWVDGLLIPLVIDFPQVKRFRFAVFFSRSLVEEKRQFPEALKYLFGTFRYMKRTATLQGATTEMEKRFICKQLYDRRRARFDHVQIHEDSLKQGVLIPKVDEDDINGYPMERDLLEEVPMATGTRPVDIKWPKVEEKVWKAPKEGSVWA